MSLSTTATATTTNLAASTSTNTSVNTSDLPVAVPGAERYILSAEEELRLEVPFSKSSGTCIVTLQKGSCELHGVELALGKAYILPAGGYKVALYTWHGCVVDVKCDAVDIVYKADAEDAASCNIAVVNTHAQLEALRDEAAAAIATAAASSTTASTSFSQQQAQPAAASQQQQQQQQIQGPRVLIIGPAESGKSSWTKQLLAYAAKLGRTPIYVDLDPADNGISVPGTLAACPIASAGCLTVEAYASSCGIGTSSSSSTATTNSMTSSSTAAGTSSTTAMATTAAASPLLLWHGSTVPQADLFKAQVTALGAKINARLQHDDWARSSGILVNTGSHNVMQPAGFQLLLHVVQALQISVVLVLGHDRLYSMMKNSDIIKNSATSAGATEIKVIKVPRSGGVVSRDANFLRQAKSRAVKKYFYGEMMEPVAAAAESGGNSSNSSNNPNTAPLLPSANATTAATDKLIPQLTPFLLQIAFSKLTIYKFSSMNLSASLLPVAAAQATEPVQLVKIETLTSSSSAAAAASDNNKDKDSNALLFLPSLQQHALLAVCHPHAVAAYERTGRAADLYNAGIAGLVAVERIVVETDQLHLLTPTAGALPSHTLLLGDITWME